MRLHTDMIWDGESGLIGVVECSCSKKSPKYQDKIKTVFWAKTSRNEKTDKL